MNIFKKCAVWAGVAFASLCSFAEGETTGSVPDISEATTSLKTMQSVVEGYVEAASPVLSSILGTILVIVLLWAGYKLIKRAIGKV